MLRSLGTRCATRPSISIERSEALETPVSLARAMTPCQRWVGIAIVVCSIGLLIPGLLAPVWIDDVLRTFSTHIPPQRWWTWVRKDVHNPLYNIVMRGWIEVFGDSEASIRLPTAACALAGGVMIWWWVGLRFGPWPALVAGALFLLNPAVILHATMAKNNLLTVALGLAVLIAHDLARTIPGRRWVIAAIATGILGVYTDLGFLYVLGPVWIATGFECVATRSGTRTGTRAGGLWTIVVVVAVASIPLVLYKAGVADRLGRQYLRPMTLGEVWHLLANWMLWGNALLPARVDRDLIAMVGTALALPLLVAGVTRLARDASGRLVLMVVTLPIVATFVASTIIQARAPEQGHIIFQERNLLPIIPAYFIVLAVGGWSMRPRWLARALVVLLIAGNLTGAVLQWTLYAKSPTSYWQRRDYAALVHAIETHARESSTGQASGPVLVVCTPTLGPLRYYTTDRSHLVYRRTRSNQPTRIVDLLRFADEVGVSSFYLVTGDGPSTSRIDLAAIARRWPTEPVTTIDGLSLYHITRPGRHPKNTP